MNVLEVINVLIDEYIFGDVNWVFIGCNKVLVIIFLLVLLERI